MRTLDHGKTFVALGEMVQRFKHEVRFGASRRKFDFNQHVAIIITYNESDIIYHSLRKLIDQGIGVYLIDNWSTDDSIEQVKHLFNRGIVGFERFPEDGPSPYFSLEEQLRHKERIAEKLKAEWIIHQDVDEIRESPWPDVSLREGLVRAGREGYNCIDHTVLRFRPVDDTFRYGTDVEAHLRYFTFETHPAYFAQRKAWSNKGARISLADSGGHSVEFSGRKVFPTRFLLKHYPIRGQVHGQRKVLRERKPRFEPVERAKGWHVHYNHVDMTTSFLSEPDTLVPYDPRLTKKALLNSPLAQNPDASFL